MARRTELPEVQVETKSSGKLVWNQLGVEGPGSCHVGVAVDSKYGQDDHERCHASAGRRGWTRHQDLRPLVCSISQNSTLLSRGSCARASRVAPHKPWFNFRNSLESEFSS